MIQAFYTGISGLQSNQTAIDIISDNLANVSTNGFRGYSAEFAPLFEDALHSASGNSSVNSEVGVGSRVQATTMSEGNGSLILSDRSTDLALGGDGWFGIQTSGKPLYTRDGAFNFDANNDLVTTDGSHVLGTIGGNISKNILTSVLSEVPLKDVGTQEKLQFPKFLTYPPEPTTNAKFFSNVGIGTGTVSAGAGVVDSQGNKNHLRLEFTKNPVQTPPNSQWNIKATTQSLDGQTIYDTKTGTAVFGPTGDLLSHTLTTIDNNGTSVKMDLGGGFNGVVSLNKPYESGSSITNGTIGGDLQGYDINKNGEVIATFTNGKQSSVGKVAVYHFQNDQGLERISGTKFAESSNSSKGSKGPFFYKDASGQNIIGTNITNFRLEGSNVDYAAGLTELIVHQKSFDASSKCISTADQMIQKALGMHK
ncbi:MAG: flagellar hook-basal body complex protein [Campylobacterales bacterium]|nr:flagellar hook-basal body complex protein [Campylobacterales bacterium]